MVNRQFTATDINQLWVADQASQYTSVAFGQRCKMMGVRPECVTIVGTVGDAL